MGSYSSTIKDYNTSADATTNASKRLLLVIGCAVELSSNGNRE